MMVVFLSLHQALYVLRGGWCHWIPGCLGWLKVPQLQSLVEKELCNGLGTQGVRGLRGWDGCWALMINRNRNVFQSKEGHTSMISVGWRTRKGIFFPKQIAVLKWCFACNNSVSCGFWWARRTVSIHTAVNTYHIHSVIHTLDSWWKKSCSSWSVDLFARFYTSQVQDFFHQHYGSCHRCFFWGGPWIWGKKNTWNLVGCQENLGGSRGWVGLRCWWAIGTGGGRRVTWNHGLWDDPSGDEDEVVKISSHFIQLVEDEFPIGMIQFASNLGWSNHFIHIVELKLFSFRCSPVRLQFSRVHGSTMCVCVF